MERLERRSQKGITLIALIVTIVVLLILATVSIRLLVDNGIIGRAEGAKNKFLEAQEKEKMKLGYTDYKMARFDTNSESEDLALLERYFNAIDLSRLFDDGLKFPDEESTIPDASKSMQLLGDGDLGDNHLFYSFIYKSNQYELHIENYGSAGINFEGVKVVGTTELKINDTEEVVGNILRGWDVKFKSGNKYKLKTDGTIELAKEKTGDEKTLERYFLGDEGKIVSLMDFVDVETGKLIGNDIIPNASEEIKLGGVYDEIEDDTYFGYGLINYKNKGYAIKFNEMNTIFSVDLVYEPKGKEGQTVKYSIDGKKENEKDWTILYDNGETLEIVSPDVIGNLTLGASYGVADEETNNVGDIDKDGKADTDLDKAIYSYNNAVSRINRYAASQITNSNKISVRSVGSNPNNPEAENSTMYKSERLSKLANGRYNGLGKGTDDNFKEDYIRMNFAGITATGDYYWLASRCVNDNPYGSRVDFSVENVGGDGRCNDDDLWYVYEYGAYGCSNTHGVRPVVKINS